METSKTLLVTGGTGFIGSHTVVEILQQDLGFDKVVIVDNLSNSNTVVLERIHQITGRTCFFEAVDIRERKQLD
jgi:UDP-glucose 4-epimerase